MIAYIVQEPFRAKSGEIRRGQIITMSEDKAKPFVAGGKIAELQHCPICGAFSWWLSLHGVLICGVCHPPMSGTVKKWIGDPEAYARLKAVKSAVVLSLDEMRERKTTRGAPGMIAGEHR